MIDFRYHLVSLVAVFLALAVGILLGAGPLRGGLGATLEAQVSELREERGVLRAELGESQQRAADRESLIETIGPASVNGRLTDVRVGVLLLPGADEGLVPGLQEMLESAEATHAVTITLSTRSEDPDEQELRDEVIGELNGLLDLPAPRRGDQPTLATVVAATLAGRDAEGQVGQWRPAETLLADNDLIGVQWHDEDNGDAPGVSDRRPPEAIIVVSSGLDIPPEGEVDPEPLATRLDLIAALAAVDLPTVVVSDAADEWSDTAGTEQDPVVAAVRADSDLRERVSTVDHVGQVSGQVVTMLTLGWTLTGEIGHFGFGSDAEELTPEVPPVRPGAASEEPVEPVPTPPTAPVLPGLPSESDPGQDTDGENLEPPGVGPSDTAPTADPSEPVDPAEPPEETGGDTAPTTAVPAP